MIEIIELFYLANALDVIDEERSKKQELIKVKFKILDYLCDLAYREKCILFNQYINISQYINSYMKLLNGWMESDKKRKQ